MLHKFAQVIEQTASTVEITDTQGVIEYVNPRFTQTSGYSAEEVLGRHSSLLKSGHTSAEEYRQMWETLQTGKVWRGEFLNRRKDDSLYWESAIISPIRDEAGQITHFAAIKDDITERKRLEQELAARERDFRSLAENLPDNIIRHNREGMTVYVNPVLERTLGGRAAAMIGTTPREYFADGSYEDYAQLLDSVLASGEVGKLEKIVPGPDGTASIHQIRMVPERDKNGAVVGALAIGRDITARKRMEDELRIREHESRRQAQFQQSLLSGLRDAGVILVVVENSRFVYTNDHYVGCQLGYTQGQLSETVSFINLIHPDDRPRIAEMHRDRLAGKPVPTSYEIGALAGDGSRLEYEFHVTTVPDTDPPQTLLLALDISERKRAELEREAHAYSLECMDRVNRAIQGTNDLEQMMSDVLDVVLSIFDCDRAFLLYPCDPDATEWWVPKERTRPEYPGVLALGLVMPTTEEDATTFRILLDADVPVKFGPGTIYPLPADVAERFGFKSFMSLALHPKQDKPWQFGIHQCSHARVWSHAEERLLQEIGRRLADALTGLSMQRNLQASEEKFRSLAENMPDSLIRYDREGRRTYINPALKRISAVRDEQMIGLTQQESNPFTMPEAFRLALEHTLATGERSELELPISTPSGDMRTNLVSIAAERAADGQILGAITIGHDITERKAAEEALRTSEERMRLFFERQLVGMAITSPEKGWIQVNDKTCEILGYTREELPRLTWPELTHPDDLAAETAQFERMLDGEIDGYTLEKRCVRKDGGIVFTKLAVGCVRRADQSVDYILAMLEDITERKQLEVKARQHLEELAHYSRLHTAGELATEIAHEINQPLTSIASYSGTLSQLIRSGRWEQGELLDTLQEITHQALRAGELIRHLRGLVCKGQQHKGRHDVNTIINGLLQLIAVDTRRFEVEVVTALPRTIPAIWADKILLEQVLLNLVHNAIEAMSTGAAAKRCLTISSSLNDHGKVEIEVRDTGPGVGKEEQEKIFEPFYTTKSKGMGMGLAICRSIVEDNDGQLWLASQPGEGASFRLTLSVAEQGEITHVS